MSMTYTSEGVVCQYKGQHFIIPLPNVANAVFDGPSEVLTSDKPATPKEIKSPSKAS
jgi:hypothetical protein